MNFEKFIAGRIISRGKGNFSKPFIRIAILSIGLGTAVMLISIAILSGFQHEIKSKIVGFGGHIQITHYDANSSYETLPIDKNQPFYATLPKEDGIRHVQVFAIKAGLIKSNEQIQGVVLKGIGNDFDWSFFKDKIIAGNSVVVNDSAKSNDVLISKHTASKLMLDVGDRFDMYFIQDPPRMRKFTVSGIYQTGMEELDKTWIICDIGHIQKLNGWDANMVGGFEVLINNFNKLDEAGELVYKSIGYDLNSYTIKELYPDIFDWLGLFDMNVAIILILMIAVSVITMISTLLILILEKTNMIGTLKALGSNNIKIRRIFLYTSGYIIGKGLLWGNLIAIVLCVLQLQYGFIKLNQESYYVSSVPIKLDILPWIALDAGAFLMCTLMMLIPSIVATRITPVKAIRFS